MNTALEAAEHELRAAVAEPTPDEAAIARLTAARDRLKTQADTEPPEAGPNPYPEKPELMSFSQALEMVKLGDKIARIGWNGKGMFLFLVPGSTFTVNRAPLLGIYPEGTVINYQPHIDMKTAQDTVVPWLASQGDLLADDWIIVE